MKTTFKRATALLLSLLMVFSVCSTALVVYAADADESNEINYVSLGDSMSNGYGLPGYDGNTGVEDYGEGAYGNQFAEWLEEKNKLCMYELEMILGGNFIKDFKKTMGVSPSEFRKNF